MMQSKSFYGLGYFLGRLYAVVKVRDINSVIA